MNIRQKMVECAQQHVEDRTPYQWGGGHHGPSWGLDCSGLVLDCARKAGIDPGHWDSSKMRDQLPPTDNPQPGDLALYLPRHVVLVESFDPFTGIATVIGENGGGPSSTSVEVALKQDARAKREPTHLYRETFVGFRSIRPWGAEDIQPEVVPIVVLEKPKGSSIGPWLLGAGAAGFVYLFIRALKDTK